MRQDNILNLHGKDIALQGFCLLSLSFDVTKPQRLEISSYQLLRLCFQEQELLTDIPESVKAH